MIANPAYSVQHFLLMAHLAERLAGVPAAIIEHNFNYYGGFGSWSFICERGERLFRFFYDGRDFSLALEEARPGQDQRRNTDWKPVACRPVPVPTSDSLPSLVVSVLTGVN